MVLSSSTLDSIRRKVEAGERLSAADGEFLFRPDVDLHAVGEWADLVRRRKHGDTAYYNVNAHLNPTNVCLYHCPLCAYSRDAGDAGAYTMSRDEILVRGREAAKTEPARFTSSAGHPSHEKFRLVSGHTGNAARCLSSNPLEGLDQPRLPGSPNPHSDRSARFSKVDWAGLGSLPGGGMRSSIPEIRRQIAPRKCDANTWLEIHRTAHGLGLRSNATMLYGHLETAAHRVDHLLRLEHSRTGRAVFRPSSRWPSIRRAID